MSRTRHFDPSGRRVAVLHGGQSNERPVSIRTGEAVLRALADRPCTVIPLDFGPDSTRELIDARPDVVFIALHGGLGENGAVQGLLECMGVPYTGSGVLASALAMDKIRSKRIFEACGVPTPDWWIARPDDPPPENGWPWVVKPSREGSSVGVRIVDDARDWAAALREGTSGDGELLVERCITGRELSVVLLDGEVLGTVEIRPAEGVYDFEAKYVRQDTEYLCPAPISGAEASAVERAAQQAWNALGCRGVGRVDVMLGEGPDEPRPWVLEANTVPGLTETSIVPRVAAHRGWSFADLVWTMLGSATRDGEGGEA
ncbi:MAG: D-alanine--D-alanine ligase [Deltaproteobacteria bacterium]|nr:MAG: D-alanine--D-alanine ligase [Deltaproteobacteria bacterium]